MSKESLYFSHDYNAQRDPKIIKMIRTHGWESYGLYWAIIERLYEQGGYLTEDYELLAYEFHSNQDKIKKVIQLFSLFIIKDGMISSESVDRRINMMQQRVNQARIASNIRWNKKDQINTTENASAMRQQCISNAINKEINKENKENKERIFKPPILLEVKNYCKERKNNVDPEKWMDHYLANGWKVGQSKAPMKDWKAAVRTWERNNYNNRNNTQ